MGSLLKESSRIDAIWNQQKDGTKPEKRKVAACV